MTQRPPGEKRFRRPGVCQTSYGRRSSRSQEYDPPKRTGCPRVDRRAVLDAVIFRLRIGCQWKRLPKEFPDDSTMHRAFQR